MVRQLLTWCLLLCRKLKHSDSVFPWKKFQPRVILLVCKTYTPFIIFLVTVYRVIVISLYLTVWEMDRGFRRAYDVLRHKVIVLVFCCLILSRVYAYVYKIHVRAVNKLFVGESPPKSTRIVNTGKNILGKTYLLPDSFLGCYKGSNLLTFWK